MSNQGAGAKKEDKEKGGSGLLGTLLVAGGAAALGYMACDLWQSFQQQNRPSPSAGPMPQRSSRQTPDSEKEAMQNRKKSRQNAHDKDVAEAVRCIICCDNPREIINEPCKHAVMCIDCAEKVQRCPVCNINIVERKMVYIS